MCGICGVFGRGDVETVRTMLGTLTHRGPDDAHAVGGADFALGACRLSIVDVEGGRQPVSNEDGTVWAAQNGELYNFPALRRDLLARGHRFVSRCDTETLPHLYEEHGADLPTRIDGMFAVAVWDDTRKMGILARDRMGKKPLYYHESGSALYFASEIKALLRLPGFERRIDLEALSHYLSYKHVPHPLSIFAGVRMLPPAHLLVYRPGAPVEIRRYWDVDFGGSAETAGMTEDEIVERFLELLRRGVERRLMSDVPIGFFLSGGIDSSLSTVLAAELSSGPIKTFTLTYAEGSSTAGKEQDRRWARWVADRYGTEHHEETIAFGDYPESLRRILRCFDEPFSGVVSTYFLAQLISRHVKVALAGDGADELFGSYLSHRLAGPLARYAEFARTGDLALIRPFESQQDLLRRLAPMPDWEWRHDLMVFTDEEKRGLWAPDVAVAACRFSTREHLRAIFAGLSATDPVNRILEAEFRTIFPDQVMTFVDRLSMAHSLEVRTAFLDTDVVRFVAGLPGRLKMRGGETKYLLKKAALRYFPEEMVFRPKEGFVMPVSDWLLHGLEGYVRQTLHPARLAKHALFDVDRVQALVDELYRGQHDYRFVNKVLSLVVFQEWHDLYMMGGE
jgi:asparagine synthase (glutamine-hydrolysing)